MIELHRQGNTLYTLKHGGHRKGEEILINGTTINVTGDNAGTVCNIILKSVKNHEALLQCLKNMVSTVASDQGYQYLEDAKEAIEGAEKNI